MIRNRWWKWLAPAVCLVLANGARDAQAAAEVRKLNLVLSGIPTSVEAKDFNTRIDNFNRIYLNANGLEGLDKIHYAWLFEAQLRYFVRPNVAVEAGIGQIRQQTKQEFLPTLNADIQLRTEVLSMPVHVGGAYYLQPYNVGDFRAQVFMGGGFLSGFYNRARMQGVAFGTDSAITSQANFKVTGFGDSPGFYVDTGVHMFFASRFSVMLSVLYRSQTVRYPRGTIEQSGVVVPIGPLSVYPITLPLGGMTEFNLSGVGARLGVAIGF